MTDRPQEKSPELENLSAMVTAAQQAYDSKVTIFNGSGAVAKLDAHGPIRIDWQGQPLDFSGGASKRLAEPDASGASLWFRSPNKNLTYIETGAESSFQIDTPTGKIPKGEKHYLTFLDEKGKVEEKSMAVGKIFDGAGNEFGSHGVHPDKHKEVLWIDDKGVFHEKSLNQINWIVSDKPLPGL